jgi:hypothetical protein
MYHFDATQECDVRHFLKRYFHNGRGVAAGNRFEPSSRSVRPCGSIQPSDCARDCGHTQCVGGGGQSM